MLAVHGDRRARRRQHRSAGGDGGEGGDLDQKCAQDNPDRFQNVECRNALYVNSIQAYWQTALPQTFGKQYQAADTVFFEQRGLAPAAARPTAASGRSTARRTTTSTST